jgi:hypothetical protein
MENNPEKRIPVRSLLVWGAVIVLVGGGLIWWQRDALCRGLCAVPPEETALASETGQGRLTEVGRSEHDAQLDALRLAWTDLVGDAPDWPADLNRPEDCLSVERDLLALCSELDSRQYVRSKIVGGSFCSVLRQASMDLASSPPVLGGETKDALVMLNNTFHMFRSLGRKRTTLFLDVMRQEQELAEPFAMIVYRWLVSRDQCADDEREQAIDRDALYAYAGFLLDSIGGQAYLRRRSMGSEALADFYAVLILDRADHERFNPAGIDLRPQLERTRQLIAASPLLFSERYLDVLDGIESRWATR